MGDRMNVPENAKTVEVEGQDLKRAIAGAAEQLGLHPAQVDYKLDMSHFRSVTGVSVARSTVRIVAWQSERDAPSDDAPAADEEDKPKRKRAPRKKKDAEATEEAVEEIAADEDDAEEDKPKRKRRRTTKKPDEEESASVEADKPEQLRGAESETTDASKFAQEWFEKLLELMGVEGQVVGTGNDQRVHLAIQAERAGRIVGKRGATLGAIRHLLSLALERRFGGLTVDVDVDGDRERRRSTPDSKPRRERSGRDRDDRDRDRDRGRGRGRGGRSGGGGRPKGKYDEDKLRALARRAAEKALETGKTFTINLQLNSYDRRVVHLEISEIDGVDSHSEERQVDGEMKKFVQVVPDAD